MRLWSFIADRQRFAEKREDNLLEEHAVALLAGDWTRARGLQAEQDPELAGLMGLAEELAQALHPVEVTPGVRERLFGYLDWSQAEESVGRIAAVVRGHGREAIVGAAIVGTAAASIVPVALYYHRKRQGVGVPGPLS